MKKNSCTPIKLKKNSCHVLKKNHTRNMITKKNSCGSKIPLPHHNFSNGPSLMRLSHSIGIAQTNYYEKSYYPVPTYFHAFVSVLSNVSPSATNCDKRRWTCNLHAAWRFWSNAQRSQGGREQCSRREDYEVEMRNSIENFRPVWQRTVRSETT